MKKLNKFDKWLQGTVTITVPKMNMVPLVLGGAAAIAGIAVACKMNNSNKKLSVDSTKSDDVANIDEVDDYDYWTVDLNVIEDEDLKNRLKETGCSAY